MSLEHPCDTDKENSSQALAIDVFGTLSQIESRHRILNEVLRTLGFRSITVIRVARLCESSPELASTGAVESQAARRETSGRFVGHAGAAEFVRQASGRGRRFAGGVSVLE